MERTLSRLLIPRRSLLKAGTAFVAAAPFIRKADASLFVGKGGGAVSGGGGGDALTALVASMTAGTWATFGSNALNDVHPATDGWSASSSAKVMQPWSGGCYDSVNKMFIVWGGGHDNYYGNEVYSFSLPTGVWSRLTNPSTYAGDPANIANDGINYSDASEGIMLSDGRPAPEHSYDTLGADPVSGGFFGWGGGQAHGGSNAYMWKFNTTSPGWTKLIHDNPAGGNATLIFKYDPAQDVYWSYGAQTHRIWEMVRSNTNTFTQFNTSADIAADFNQSGVIDPVHKRAYAIGNGICGYYSVDIVGGTVGTTTVPSVSGSTTAQADQYPGLAYHTPTGDIVAVRGANGSGMPATSTVWRLNTTTHVWTAVTAGGGSAVPQGDTDPNYAGTFGRFEWLPSYGCFGLVCQITGPFYIYKPNF